MERVDHLTVYPIRLEAWSLESLKDLSNDAWSICRVLELYMSADMDMASLGNTVRSSKAKDQYLSAIDSLQSLDLSQVSQLLGAFLRLWSLRGAFSVAMREPEMTITKQVLSNPPNR